MCADGWIGVCRETQGKKGPSKPSYPNRQRERPQRHDYPAPPPFFLKKNKQRAHLRSYVLGGEHRQHLGVVADAAPVLPQQPRAVRRGGGGAGAPVDCVFLPFCGCWVLMRGVCARCDSGGGGAPGGGATG